MTKFSPEDRVVFKPLKGKVRQGTVKPGFVDTGFVKVLLDGDPFPTDLRKKQVQGCDENGNVVSSNKKVPKAGTSKQNRKDTSEMTTTTKPSAKQLRQEAQALGIEWEDMGRDELAAAIKAAKKKGSKTAKPAKGKKSSKKSKPKATSTKPAKAAKSEPAPKKKASKAKATNGTAKKTTKVKESAAESDGISLPKSTPPKDLPDEGVNPFRPNSNLHIVAKLLLKGGSRQKLAEQLSQKVTLHPYQKADADVNLGDFDKRLLLGAQTMRDTFGYGVHRTGRGIDGKILVFRPGGDKDPRKKGKSKK